MVIFDKRFKRYLIIVKTGHKTFNRDLFAKILENRVFLQKDPDLDLNLV